MAAALSPAVAQTAAVDEPGAVDLPAVEIEASADEQERWPEERENLFPFRRGALVGIIETEEAAADEEFSVLSDQLAALTSFQPGEFATASGAATPRGFTTPRLRNGLNQSGFPEIIIGGRRELLTGFLATYFGRTAPGGILNSVSRRPSPKPMHVVSTRGSTISGFSGAFERNAPLVPKKLHYRLTTEARHREGPQDFAEETSAISGVALRFAPSPRTVWLVELEGAWVEAHPAGGVPLARATRGAPRSGLYAPLAEFNTNGPHAWSRRQSTSLSVLAEHQFADDLRLRAGAEVWQREQRELRFNTGPYLLDARVFEGTREPHYNGREQEAMGFQVELDGHGRFGSFSHRWLVGFFASAEQLDRVQRALPVAVRNALPAAVRRLDPLAPDWTLPGYDPETYSRLLALHEDQSDFRGLFLSERIAVAGDRLYGTVGLRSDRVDSSVRDLRPGASLPRADATVDRTTYHAGLVWHVVPNRVAAYFNRSTAFQPARRVDSRTGHIIGNESTSGAEAGLRLASADGKLSLTWGAFRLWNENITRTNPRYNDPVFDPDGREPQFVSSGEEQFTGSELGLRRSFESGWNLSARAAWLDAITTSSPDLPEEVGRQLSRLPRLTASTYLGYRFQQGRLKGMQLATAYAWVGRHVAVYESVRRNQARLEYGSYGVLNLSAAYNWTRAKRQHSVNVALRNVLDRDLVAAAGRPGGDLALDAGYGLRF